MRKLIIALTCVSALATAPAALAQTATATGRGVTARLSYAKSAETLPVARTLTISVHGHDVYRRAVAARPCGHSCSVALDAASGSQPVHVRDLQGDGTADVVVDLYTGGAHCCSIEQVLSPSKDGSRWFVHQHDFGDPGATLQRRARGGYVFVSADDRFADAFTDFAASGLPLQILSFTGTRFVDVTGDFRSRIVADAATWLRAYYRQASSNPPYGDTVGVIAAWAADEYRLGRVGFAQRLLAREARAGHLRSALPEAQGMRFVTRLEGFLRQTGYVSYG